MFDIPLHVTPYSAKRIQWSKILSSKRSQSAVKIKLSKPISFTKLNDVNLINGTT